MNDNLRKNAKEQNTSIPPGELAEQMSPTRLLDLARIDFPVADIDEQGNHLPPFTILITTDDPSVFIAYIAITTNRTSVFRVYIQIPIKQLLALLGGLSGAFWLIERYSAHLMAALQVLLGA